MMDEDPTQNRMNDSLLLYNSLLVNTFLKLNSIIVFFNKYDLIDEKLKKYKIADFLPEYDGTNDKKAWIAWLEKKFGEKADQHNVVLHKHKTTATDPKLMKKVIESVKELIFRDQSKNLGLI
ncbi:guanine nucleotide binding protein, alpha subunit [Gorgonomyces haynaldii]|nr:guanine nucleotide binding protein, alpha subunit [Gorgonomyces haynaldii]